MSCLRDPTTNILKIKFTMYSITSNTFIEVRRSEGEVYLRTVPNLRHFIHPHSFSWREAKLSAGAILFCISE
jgi:hypothetical protein